MSEAMIGVLLMPDDLFWSDDPVTRAQHNSIRKEAAEEIDRLRAEVEKQRKRAEALVDLSNGLDKMRKDALAEVGALREDKARLLRLVEQAYKEGHVRGVSGYDDPAGYEEQDWLDSEVRQAINAAREDA